jgi:ligand-binding sensor domain-containing protein/anti-sigma regulatory factor (Ser/Thr protein kinase)
MLHHRLILLLLLFACFSARSYGQAFQYQLEIFGTRNGMLSSKVHALAQTNDRKIWIGTELGISVYDGYSFSNYQYSAANESIGRILCIAQDHLNGVWVGGDKGLFYFNESSISKIELQSKTILAVEALLTDGDGNVWLGDINALYKITAQQVENIHTKHLTTVNLSPFASFTKRVFGLTVDNQQNIYAASYDGVFTIKRNAVKYETIWVSPDPYKYVRSVAAISPDSIFWNRLDLHPTQMINGKVQTTFTEDFLGRTVFTNQQKAFALTTSCVGSFSDGVVKPLVLFGNVTNNAITALIDIEENIWVGSWEGLQKFRRTAFQQYSLQHKEQKEIFSFLEKGNGDLLFGSNRGLVFTKNEAAIVPHKTIPSLFPLAEVLCMYEHKDESLWVGSGYQGISRFKNGKLTNWREAIFLKDNNCEALYPAADGKLFACTENGVTVIDPDAADPMVAYFPLQKKYTRWPELFGCFQTANSAYWFYGSQGLYKLQNGQLVDDSIQGMPVKNLYINKIISDNKGNVWVATQGKGLLQCAYKNAKLVLQKQYDSRKGLPSDIALSVLVDKNSNIWLGDFMSLSVLINPGKEERLITFNEKDGLLSAYYQSLKLEQQRNGTIWGLTSMGMFSFHPDSITFNTLAPVLLINTVIVNGSEDKFSASSAQQFSYRHNSLQFNYTAVSLTDPIKIRYAYRLKELDSNWVYTTNRTVDFNFLRPGNYTFELKACNNSNVWTSNPLQYQFTIRPPFWQTWWFRVLLFSIVALALYLFYKRRINNLKAKAAIKQQMAELEGKAIRAQMNPHFIFNSLNAIQESIVTEKIDVAYDYLSRFSKLLRMVLDNSDKNLIPLSSELETIRLYLSLEALRFSQSFSYTIESNDMLDKEDIYIPSLLLQPFVENAIWHGLINKEGEKLLQIRFSENEGTLQCVIEDNGVGRERAAQIKEQKLGAGRFESKGTKLALQRIEILNRNKPGSATIKTIDLLDETGNAAGTKVVITLANDLIPQKSNDHD